MVLISPALFFIFDMRHGNMDGALGTPVCTTPAASSARQPSPVRSFVFTDRDAFTDFAHHHLASRYLV